MVGNRFLRALLWPLAWLYGMVVTVRGWLYDVGWLRSESVQVPTLVVGNLAVGGTGKSPMARDLLERLTGRGGNVALLSRGYGRQTKGFWIVDAERSRASVVGDEPLMAASGLPGITVAVCEDRVQGCRRLAQLRSPLRAVVLDDAYQHRRLRGKVNLLLTEYGRLYVDDYPLPVGRLRDTVRQAHRADAVVVTKCPNGLSQEDAARIASRLGLRAGKRVLFAAVEHGEPYSLLGELKQEAWGRVTEVVGVAGIANTTPFFDWLAREKHLVWALALRDHQRYRERDVRQLKQWAAKGRKIVTTEKDAVRLEEAARGDMALLEAVWVAPIAVRWLFDGENEIEELLDGLLR